MPRVTFVEGPMKPAVLVNVDRFLAEGRFRDMYEPETTLAAQRIVKPGMTCIDVGANIGWYTALFDRLCSPGGQVWAIEPITWHDVEALREFLPTLRGVLRYGLDATRDRRSVQKDYRAWTLIPCEPSLVGKTDVRVVEFAPLDDLVQQFLPAQRVHVIKIDVDGAEVRVLRGAVKLLTRDHPTLVLEIAPQFTELLGDHSYEGLALLESLGYGLFHEVTDVRMTPAQIVAGVPHWSSWNIICRPV